jgi:hypothetical protein
VPAGNAFIRVFEGNTPAQSQLYTLSVTIGELVVACPGDADGDGDVDLDDLLLVLGNFGGTGSGDVDGDNDVDLDDLLLVLGAFGTTC